MYNIVTKCLENLYCIVIMDSYLPMVNNQKPVFKSREYKKKTLKSFNQQQYTLRICHTPVSYTHLDVYKRQQ